MFWKAFDIVLVLVALGIVAAQMVVPQIKGTRWFPIFDRENRAARERAGEVEDKIDTENIRAATRKRERDLARIGRK